jgi:thiamine biosynthesis lipoprotein
MPQSSATFEFDAMGTHWWIESLGGCIIDDNLRQSIDEIVERFVGDYSRFDDSTVLSQINNFGSINNPSIELLDMMNYARRMHSVTDGVFNISVGGTLNEIGYGSSKQVAETDNNFWKKVVMSSHIIQIPKSTSIDFGGFGKGWLIDKLSKFLLDSGVGEYIINGGGDIYVNSKTPIELGLEHPYDNTKIIGTTMITRGALAVSSIIKRSWKNNDVSFHHIIDPRSRVPTDGRIVASYIRAETALIADTMATCLLIRPELKDRMAAEYDLKIILISKDQLSESK